MLLILLLFMLSSTLITAQVIVVPTSTTESSSEPAFVPVFTELPIFNISAAPSTFSTSTISASTSSDAHFVIDEEAAKQLCKTRYNDCMNVSVDILRW